MKKSLGIILVLLFSGVCIFLGYSIISKINYKKEVQKHIKTIPKFSFLNLEGQPFTHKNLKKGIPVIFIYFNTECEYCHEEASMIEQYRDRFKDFQLLFISFEKPEKIRKFSQHYKLDHYDHVHFLFDSQAAFASAFDAQSLPCIILYDKNHNLIDKIKGQVRPENLFKKLNNQKSL